MTKLKGFELNTKKVESASSVSARSVRSYCIDPTTNDWVCPSPTSSSTCSYTCEPMADPMC